MASWTRDGIAGLQSVVLYSLPELDGAIDSIPLGGLVNNDIYLVPERVDRLAARIQKWVHLRRTPAKVGFLCNARHKEYPLKPRQALLLICDFGISSNTYSHIIQLNQIRRANVIFLAMCFTLFCCRKLAMAICISESCAVYHSLF